MPWEFGNPLSSASREPKDRTMAEVVEFPGTPSVRLPEGVALPRGEWSAPRVGVSAFEGPIDLLLYLVKDEKIAVRELPLHQITEAYLRELEGMREMALEPASEFLVFAATLIYLKSRACLPKDETAVEETLEPVPASELIRLLEEYERFKIAREDLGRRFEERLRVFARPVATGGRTDSVLVSDFGDLLKALQVVLARAPILEAERMLRPKIHLADCIEAVRAELALRGEVSFEALFPLGSTKEFVIAQFLALLELIRTGEILAIQEAPGAPISIRRKDGKEKIQ